MELNTCALLLKNRFRLGGLILVMLICVLQIPSYAQSCVCPEYYGLAPSLTISEDILSFKPKDLLKSSRKQPAIDKATLVFQPIAGQIQELADAHAFSDWMQIQLAMKTAKALYQSPSGQALAAVGLMRALGFNAVLLEFRDADSGEQNTYGVAVASRQKIFGGVMFEHEKSLFILLDLQKESVRKNMNGSATTIILGAENTSASGPSLSPIDLEFLATPRLPMQPQKTTLLWSDTQGSYRLPLTVNANLIRYDASYPQLEVMFHLNRPINADVLTGLIQPLKTIIVQKKFTEDAAVQFLLSFCHHAFTHLDDIKNTGIEHHNSVEETLVANASDCEDFVLLLSVLIRGVLGYPVIGLEYPNHLSLAVALPEGYLKGERYRYKEKTYVHCDPSFVGGKLGDVQPDFKEKDPKVIPIGNLLISGN
jgi:hypothetical protein